MSNFEDYESPKYAEFKEPVVNKAFLQDHYLGLDIRPIYRLNYWYMISTSISQLKANPSAVIEQAADYPVAVESRNDVKAYLIGKNLFEKMIAFIENYADAEAVKKADFKSGKDLEDVAKELGI